jgi:hypothetical protein
MGLPFPTVIEDETSLKVRRGKLFGGPWTGLGAYIKVPEAGLKTRRGKR